MQKKVLITGGLGFIGSHLAEALVRQGYHVHIVDNKSSHVVERIAGATCFWMSIQEYLALSLDFEYDEIYHLASPVGPAGILPHSGNIVKAVVDDTYGLIQLALRTGARLLDVSTSEIYGGGQEGLCREDMPRIVPAQMTVRLEYAIAKLAAEAAILNTCKVKPLNAVIVRPFNVAGPRQKSDGGFVLPRFIEQAMRDGGITIFGTGGQIRAFTHVLDIVDGLMQAMQFGVSGECYNLGNPDNKIRIWDLALKVKEIIGGGVLILTNGKAIYGPLYSEASDKFPDAQKASAELDWCPRRTIDETIHDAWDTMRGRA